MKYRIRSKGETKKGKKYVLQKYYNGKWETRTLSPSKELWDALCPDTKDKNVSDNSPKTPYKAPQEFGESILTEVLDIDKKRTLTEEETKKLWELSK